MERIVLEVDEQTAKKWQIAPPEIRKGLEKKIEELLERVSYEIKVSNFEALLDKASDEAERNGLTEEILEKLLNEE
ncbi:MAG TPA: hypothetical protein VN722_08910 [Hanamia sp.]|nr:hypothetical protein [Hanamia sp.]